MPPKTKITKEEIVAAAIELIRESGMPALNARGLAKKLNSSTQPIFSNYPNMEKLKADVLLRAKIIYQKHLDEGMKNPAYPPYKASGIAYISFARQERELFKLLFMRDRSQEEITEERSEIEGIIELISASTGMSPDEAYYFHIEMWVFVHGIATMIANSYLDWDEETVSCMMTDVYTGLKNNRIKNGE